MHAPRTRRHTQTASKAGVSIEEIFEVLKLWVAQGAQAINLGVPILEEELARAETKPSAQRLSGQESSRLERPVRNRDRKPPPWRLP